MHNTEKQISFQVNWVNTQAFFQLGTGLFNWVSHVLIPVALLEIGYSLKQMTFGKQWTGLITFSACLLASLCL